MATITKLLLIERKSQSYQRRWRRGPSRRWWRRWRRRWWRRRHRHPLRFLASRSYEKYSQSMSLRGRKGGEQKVGEIKRKKKKRGGTCLYTVS